MPHDDQRAAADAAAWLRDLLGDRRVWAEAPRQREQVQRRRRPLRPRGDGDSDVPGEVPGADC